MNCPECTAKLNDYVDGELAADEARAVEAHIAQCGDCHRQLTALRALITSAARLPKEIAPQRNRWTELRLELQRLEPKPWVDGVDEESGPRSSRAASGNIIARWFAPLAIAASVALLSVVAERWVATSNNRPAWSVANLAGLPRLDTITFDRETPFRIGQWLETDAGSRAKVTVGSVGEVTVDPNSRLRLTGVAETDHRLQLARGKLSAFIWAPPRIFFVDTPSATAVDLGCAYTLTVDDNGDGELHVTTGYVALEHGKRESIIPARAMCLTRRGAGPGTPFVEDASVELRTALKRFDFERGAVHTALPAILGQARPEDAITLWHLLTRTEGTQRAAVFDTLAKQHAPPESVTRDGILVGNDAMRRAWGAELGLSSSAFR